MIKIRNNVKVTVIVIIDDDNFLYLNDCLNSLINQTLEDIEIFCINKSHVDSIDIKSYFDYESFYFLSFEEFNFSKINGKYVSFIHPTDSFSLVGLETLYDFSVENELDLVYYPILMYDIESQNVYENEYYNYSKLNNLLNKYLNVTDDKVFSIKNLPKELFNISIDLNNKFFKTSLFNSNEFNFYFNNPFFNFYATFITYLTSKKIKLFNNPLLIKKTNCIEEEYSKAKTGFENGNTSDELYLNINSKIFDKNYLNSFSFFRDENDFNLIVVFDEILRFAYKINFYNLYKFEFLNYEINLIRHIFNNLDESHKENFFIKLNEYFKFRNDDYASHIDYVLNLDTDNLFFYRSIFNSKSYMEFKLIYNNRRLFISNVKFNSNLSSSNLKIKKLEKKVFDLSQKIVVIDWN